MKRTNGSKLALAGVFCLPTSSKSHIHEPNKGTAFKEGQYMYLLRATQSIEDGGYPQLVCLTSDEPITNEVKLDDGTTELREWELDQEVSTQHAEVRKNLPPRYVAAIRHPDGSIEGDVTPCPRGVSVPHWEFIGANPDGSARLTEVTAVRDRMEANKKAAKDAKEAVKNAKKSVSAGTAAAPASTSAS